MPLFNLTRINGCYTFCRSIEAYKSCFNNAAIDIPYIALQLTLSLILSTYFWGLVQLYFNLFIYLIYIHVPYSCYHVFIKNYSRIFLVLISYFHDMIHFGRSAWRFYNITWESLFCNWPFCFAAGLRRNRYIGFISTVEMCALSSFSQR